MGFLLPAAFSSVLPRAAAMHYLSQIASSFEVKRRHQKARRRQFHAGTVFPVQFRWNEVVYLLAIQDCTPEVE